MHIGDVLDHLCCQNALFSAVSDMKTKKSAEGQTRTVDTGIFSAVLYHLSYLGAALLSFPRPIDVKPLPLCRRGIRDGGRRAEPAIRGAGRAAVIDNGVGHGV